ncbi:hypothetical protein SCHPADRAFT_689168 [Schizopora paradoxa]|uniref:Uncharacterized protein n=1 Tax=Schizopora paradoxa TaxID=27342 RepID=A0A0H2R3W9_9AGAM|nr:hypothetical protein SCHPADRAFT_689168 [Schizopora paradoxa]
MEMEMEDDEISERRTGEGSCLLSDNNKIELILAFRCGRGLDLAKSIASVFTDDERQSRFRTSLLASKGESKKERMVGSMDGCSALCTWRCGRASDAEVCGTSTIIRLNLDICAMGSPPAPVYRTASPPSWCSTLCTGDERRRADDVADGFVDSSPRGGREPIAQLKRDAWTMPAFSGMHVSIRNSNERASA